LASEFDSYSSAYCSAVLVTALGSATTSAAVTVAVPLLKAGPVRRVATLAASVA